MMPNCTQAERDLLEATLKVREHYTPANICCKDEAMGVVLAERHPAEHGTVTPTNDAHEEEYARQVAEARIAELEAALAEERAKPKEGARGYAVHKHVRRSGIAWAVNTSGLEWRELGGEPTVFTGPDAERHAREQRRALAGRAREGRCGVKVFMVTFDGQNSVVEAASMGLAIAVWHDAMKVEWGDEYTGEEEPDQVALLHDEPVIRAKAGQS